MNETKTEEREKNVGKNQKRHLTIETSLSFISLPFHSESCCVFSSSTVSSSFQTSSIDAVQFSLHSSSHIHTRTCSCSHAQSCLRTHTHTHIWMNGLSTLHMNVCTYITHTSMLAMYVWLLVIFFLLPISRMYSLLLVGSVFFAFWLMRIQYIHSHSHVSTQRFNFDFSCSYIHARREGEEIKQSLINWYSICVLSAYLYGLRH